MTAGRLHRIKKDNLKPYLQFQLFNPDGSPRNLSGSTLTFTMRKPGQTKKVDAGVCTAINANIGLYEYRFTGTQTSESGTFQGEVTINGNETYPTEGYIVVEVTDDLS